MRAALDLAALLTMVAPCCILSVVSARKNKPIVGGFLALLKLLSTFRVGGILEYMLRSSGKRGWQMWGLEYAPAGTALLVSVLAISAICVIWNLYVLVRALHEPVSMVKA